MILAGRSSTKRLKTNAKNSPLKFGGDAEHTERTGPADRENKGMYVPAQPVRIVKTLEKPLAGSGKQARTVKSQQEKS
jgi:hypothetical protein